LQFLWTQLNLKAGKETGFIISATHSLNTSPYCLGFSTKVKATFADTFTSISAKKIGGPT